MVLQDTADGEDGANEALFRVSQCRKPHCEELHGERGVPLPADDVDVAMDRAPWHCLQARPRLCLLLSRMNVGSCCHW